MKFYHKLVFLLASINVVSLFSFMIYKGNDNIIMGEASTSKISSIYDLWGDRINQAKKINLSNKKNKVVYSFNC